MFGGRNPLVPLGCLATAAVLCRGVVAMYQGDKILSQKMMRGRACTIQRAGSGGTTDSACAASLGSAARNKHGNQTAPCATRSPKFARTACTGILAQGVTVVTIAAGAILARTEAQRKRRLEEEATRQVREQEMTTAQVPR